VESTICRVRICCLGICFTPFGLALTAPQKVLYRKSAWFKILESCTKGDLCSRSARATRVPNRCSPPKPAIERRGVFSRVRPKAVLQRRDKNDRRPFVRIATADDAGMASATVIAARTGGRGHARRMFQKIGKPWTMSVTSRR
jgi:hypothetical protein